VLLESVPNISEGRDLSVIDTCVAAAARAGARVLHRTSDPTHNRSVLTIAGEYEALRDAAIALAAVTVERIDLRAHSGVHPRIGALDVLPFVPLRNAAMPVVSIAAVQLGFMLGGSVVIESVFALPGVGYLAWESITKNDFPVVQAVVLFLAVIYIVLTLLADMMNALLDPRLRE